jgi:DNA-binding transcriptional regulator YhcF (GntR family)
MSTLDLAVDRTSEVPLGTQLIWKLRTLIATGRVSPGDRLPGIREVAETADVNVNTVRSVFARLEDQGLLVTQHGRGTFVAPGVRPAAILSEMADAAIASAQQAGIDPRELAAVLYVASNAPPAPSAEGLEHREQRRAIRDEIVKLERELGALDPLGTLEPAGEAGTPRLLSLTELSSVRDGLATRLDELRRERQQWRIESEQLEREELEAARINERSGSRWREAGVWTGPRVRVSWSSS